VLAGAIYPRRLHPITGAIAAGGPLGSIGIFPAGQAVVEFERGPAPHAYMPGETRSREVVHAGLELGDWDDFTGVRVSEVISLRAGVLGDDGAAIVSAMLALGELGQPPEVLWVAPDDENPSQ